MSLTRITTLERLQDHLYAALQLEHATIPPYLTALYSIQPGTNSEAFHVIRTVAVEEMLHLTLVANLLNAVGGRPDLTRADFVPEYPAYLPDGETDFQVSRRRFSKEAIETFLKIERPAGAEREEGRHVRRERRERGTLHASRVSQDAEEHFFSIGEFYLEIERAIEHLHGELSKKGESLFTGDPDLQVTPDLYYSGGGELTTVTDLESAREAIRLISEQGEGLGGAIYDYEGELSHYYRFQQLTLGRFYMEGDEADHPSGGPVEVDWDAVYPIRTDAKIADYPEASEVRQAALAFNRFYQGFLELLNRAYNGQPQLLIEAVGEMFRIKELAYQLMRHPIGDGSGEHAAPTFEIPVTGEG